METTHGKTHSEKRRGEVLVVSNRIPYSDANNVAPPATNDEKEYHKRSLSRCNRRLLHALTAMAQPPLKRRQPRTTGGAHGAFFGVFDLQACTAPHGSSLSSVGIGRPRFMPEHQIDSFQIQVAAAP